MKLDILIPTYNRCKPLIKNLESLKTILNQLGGRQVRIIISDNASTDGTVEAVNQLRSRNNDLDITLLCNSENVGFTNNVINIVGASKADYILLLGDDDYINYSYLSKAIQALENDPEIHCILPACEGIDEEGIRLGRGRDLEEKTTLYESGTRNVIENSYRAHQISGIIVKREGLINALNEKMITNLYPQIFMVSFCCLTGKCLHIPEFPILATETSNKAWRYDETGLLNDIFQNYSALELDNFSQFKAELKIINSQRWRTLRYWKNPIKQFRVISKISWHHNTSKLGHVLFPLIISYYWGNYILSTIIKRVKCLSSRN